MGFDPDTYTIMEGMTSSLSIALVGESDILVTVALNTQDGTALGKHHFKADT